MRITLRLTGALAALAVLMLLSVPSALAGGAGTFGWMVVEDHHSGVSGQATATDNGDGTTTIVIEVQGYSSGSVLVASIHDGKYDGYKADPTFVLNDVVNGSSTTTIPMSLMELQSQSRILLLQDPSSIVAFGQLESI